MSKPTIVVIRQLGGIGDVLALSPVFRGLKEQNPKHHIICVTSNYYLSGAIVELAHHNSYIGGVICVEPFDATTDVTKGWWREFGASERLEDHLLIQKADKVIDLNVACIQRERDECEKHGKVITPRYKIWCEAAGVVPSSYDPVYVITKPEQAQANKFLETYYKRAQGKPIIGIGLAACDPKRSVSLAFMRQAALLLQDSGFYPVTIDATNKLDGIDYIVGKRVSEIIPIINNMAAMVTVDSGLLHCAGAVKTPLVGIFGPTDYTMRMNNYPGVAIDSTKLMPCAPCWYAYPCLKSLNQEEHTQCLKKISPALIVEATERLVRSKQVS